MVKPRKLCFIVDAYSSGKLLAGEFLTRGIECAHIQSSQEIPAARVASLQRRDFLFNIVNASTTQTLTELKALREFVPLCIIPGTETGVSLADELSEKLGLPTNGSRLSMARRNKYQMFQALRSAHLPAILSGVSDTVGGLLRWRAENHPRGEVVVKPASSAG